MSILMGSASYLPPIPWLSVHSPRLLLPLALGSSLKLAHLQRELLMGHLTGFERKGSSPPAAWLGHQHCHYNVETQHVSQKITEMRCLPGKITVIISSRYVLSFHIVISNFKSHITFIFRFSLYTDHLSVTWKLLVFLCMTDASLGMDVGWRSHLIAANCWGRLLS